MPPVTQHGPGDRWRSHADPEAAVVWGHGWWGDSAWRHERSRLAAQNVASVGDGRIIDMGSPGWLDRYLAGRRAEVWHELRQLGADARKPDVLEEAQAVCDQMAVRAKQNVETIVTRLTEQDYRFHTNDDEQAPIAAHHPPGPEAPELAAWLQAHFVRVPLTLLSWMRLVGDVWLVGTHPLWTASASADPLVIEVEGTRYPGESIRDFEEEHDAHQLWANESAEEVSPFVLPLAPDRLHKDNVSGGSPYGIIVPDGCADGIFVAETAMPFVSYLNWVFSKGGFPGCSASSAPWTLREALAKDLLPL